MIVNSSIIVYLQFNQHSSDSSDKQPNKTNPQLYEENPEVSYIV